MVTKKNRTIIQPVMVKWMREHPDVIYHISDIARDTGFSDSQVSNSVGRLVAGRLYPIEMKARGFYIWHSDGREPADAPAPTPRMFEYVGTRRDGALIARGEDDKLYELQEF